MTEIPDLSSQVLCPAFADEGRRVRTVGWLGASVPRAGFGRVSAPCMEALQFYTTAHHRDDGMLGMHACELCTRDPAETHGEFYIDLGSIRYVMPDMLLHYVKDHGYGPPRDFLDALEKHWLEHGAETLRANPEARCVLPEAERYTYETKLTPEQQRRLDELRQQPETVDAGLFDGID